MKQAKGPTVYIDPEHGDDRNDGLTPATAIRTTRELAYRLHPPMKLSRLQKAIVAMLGARSTPMTYGDMLDAPELRGFWFLRPTRLSMALDGLAVRGLVVRRFVGTLITYSFHQRSNP